MTTFKEAVKACLDNWKPKTPGDLNGSISQIETFVEDAIHEWAEANNFLFDDVASEYYAVDPRAMSLSAFRASKTESADIRIIFGDCDLDEPLPGLVYAGTCCICKNVHEDDTYYLMIGNQVWEDRPLEELEELLYKNYYLMEFA